MRIKFLKKLKSVCIFIFLIFLLNPAVAFPISFIADLHELKNGKTTISKFSFKDNSYRVDTKEDGKNLIILVNSQTKKIQILFPSQNAYKEFETADLLGTGLFKIPFEAYRYNKKTYLTKFTGKETVNNIKCNTRTIESNGKILMKVWIAPSYKFPMKIINTLNGFTAELKDLKSMPLDPIVFKVPKGFTKQAVEKLAKAVIPTGITTSMKGASPWARRISNGGEIRVTTNPKETIKIKVENLINNESVVRVTAMRKGKVIGTEMSTNTDRKIILKKHKGTREELLIGLQHKTDEVIISVEKGVVLAIVKQKPLPSMNKREMEEYYLMGKDIKLSTDPKKNLQLTIAGDSQDSKESRVTVTFYKGSNIDKTVEVKLDNGKTKTWKYPSGNGIQTINIAVTKESWVKASLDQRKPFQLSKDTKAQISLAIRNSDLDKIESFLDRGLDVNTTLQDDGTSLLMEASNNADAKMVKMLLARGADINSTNKYGWTALLKALDNRKNWITVTPVLINSGAGVNAVLKSTGQTPLLKAVALFIKNQSAAIEIIKLLLSKSVDVNARSKTGKTALDYARERGHKEVVKLLTVKGEKEKTQTVSAKPQPSLSENKKEISQEKINAPARMILVFDASGSMWGQIKGKAKITIAKEVMADLIENIPSNFHTGLIVYGHRRKGDCNDIEMIMPVSLHNASAMKTKINAINPKGKTPLSESIRQAALALRHVEEKATVILVSDGLETCNVDPCKLAEELAMTGVDFTIHVIGFDISKGDQERLRCLADKTGGLFLAANDAGSLREALFKTVEKVKEAPDPIIEDPGTATLKAPESVPAGSSFKVEWEGPDSKNDYISIALKGTEDLKYVNYRYTKQGNPLTIVAPPDIGDYELRYIHSHSSKILGKIPIKVTKVQASIKVPESANVASEFEVVWKGPEYHNDYICISKPEQEPGHYVHSNYTRKGNPLIIKAPGVPGTYEVRYIMGIDNTLLEKTTILINAVVAQVKAPASVKAASEFEVTWQGPANHNDYICISKPDQGSGHYVKYTRTSYGSPLKMTAPKESGTYEIRYIQGTGSKTLAKVTITILPK